jgi:hypothetical protein
MKPGEIREESVMRKLFYASVLMSAIGAACLGSAAQAGETKVTGFYAITPNNSRVIAKEDGSSVVLFDMKGLLIIDDQSNPWHGALMDCNGVGAYAADGSLQTQGGTCVIVDADGDVLRLPWENTGPEGGTSEVAGGTGKYANMTGTGTWMSGAPLPDGRFLNPQTFTQITP